MISLIVMTGFGSQTTEPQECLFLKGVLAAPALKALNKEKIDSLDKLSDYTEKELLQFHGFGKNTVEKLKNFMKENDFAFRLED